MDIGNCLERARCSKVYILGGISNLRGIYDYLVGTNFFYFASCFINSLKTD